MLEVIIWSLSGLCFPWQSGCCCMDTDVVSYSGEVLTKYAMEVLADGRENNIRSLPELR